MTTTSLYEFASKETGLALAQFPGTFPDALITLVEYHSSLEAN